VRLGTILLWGEDVEEFRRQVTLAESLGYDVIGVGDSPAAWNELYVSLTVAALASSSAIVTPMVTTPFLRSPTATAAAISSLHRLTDGRAMVTIGSGGSALRAVGRDRPATGAELRTYVTAVRALLDGESTDVDGRQALPLALAQRTPLFMSADGPRSLELAGELADGVVVSVGLDLDRVAGKVASVRAGAERAGRDPEAVEVWGLSFASVRPTREQALGDVSAFLASTAGMGLKAPHMRTAIPTELLPAVQEIEQRYDATQHVVVGGANALLLEQLGLADFVAGLNSVVGTPEQVTAHLSALAERGVSRVLVALPGNADPDGTLHRLAAAAGLSAR
jgi:5,10-methylenetetrahydromethanopterin reductase